MLVPSFFEEVKIGADVEEEIMRSSQSSSRKISPNVFLIGMVLIGLALTVVIINQLGRSPINVLPSSSSSEQVFSSKQDGFSVQTPTGWNAMSAEELAKYKRSFAFAVEREAPRGFFGVKVQEGKVNDVNLKEIVSGLDKATTEEFESVKNQHGEIVKLNGHDAIRYDFTFTFEGKRMREQIVVIPTPSKIYHMSATAVDKDYDILRTDFDKLIKNFTISD